MTRASLVKGPAKCVYTPATGAATFFSKDDFNVALEQSTFDVRNSAHGLTSQRVLDVMAKATMTPEGRLTAAMIAGLWPYASSLVGTSIFGAADQPLAFHASDGALHTILAAAVTKMPDLLFSAVNTMVGPVEFTGMRADGMDWDDADSLYTIASGATFTDSTFSDALIKTQAYTGAFGAVAGFTAFDTLDGFKVTFPLETSAGGTDPHGILTRHFQSVGAIVTCIPVGATSAQILAAAKVQGAGAARGRALGGTALTITGADSVVYLTIPSCSITNVLQRFGAGENILRNGEVAFVAQRTFAAGVPQALFTLAAS